MCTQFNFNILKSYLRSVWTRTHKQRHTQAQLDTTDNVKHISLALALSEKSCLISFCKYRLRTETEETELKLSSPRRPTCPNIKTPTTPCHQKPGFTDIRSQIKSLSLFFPCLYLDRQMTTCSVQGLNKASRGGRRRHMALFLPGSSHKHICRNT